MLTAKDRRLLGIVWAILAVVCLFYVISTIVFAFVPGIREHHISTTGEVVRIHGDLPGNPPEAWVYYPVVRFRDAEGVEHECVDYSKGATEPQYEVGMDVSLRYDPTTLRDKGPIVRIEPPDGGSTMSFGFRVVQVIAFVGVVPFVALAYRHLSGKSIGQLWRKRVAYGST